MNKVEINKGIMQKMGYMVTHGPWLSKQSYIIIHFIIIIKNMKHFLGSVGVRGSVRGPFFTRHHSGTLYHRYMTKHPELRKGRHRLFIPFKDNNAGKELTCSGASNSWWICTTMVDSHASLQISKNIPGSYGGREVVHDN